MATASCMVIHRTANNSDEGLTLATSSTLTEIDVLRVLQLTPQPGAQSGAEEVPILILDDISGAQPEKLPSQSQSHAPKTGQPVKSSSQARAAPQQRRLPEFDPCLGRRISELQPEEPPSYSQSDAQKTGQPVRLFSQTRALPPQGPLAKFHARPGWHVSPRESSVLPPRPRRSLPTIRLNLEKGPQSELYDVVAVFVDGSFLEIRKGDGWGGVGLAFVKNGRWSGVAISLGRVKDSHEAERRAIREAIRLAQELPLPSRRRVLGIYTDCEGGIDSIMNFEAKRRKVELARVSLTQEIIDERRRLFQQGTRTELRWVKGHDISLGNELADYLAGSASKQSKLDGAFKGLRSGAAPRIVPLSEHEIAEMSKKAAVETRKIVQRKSELIAQDEKEMSRRERKMAYRGRGHELEMRRAFRESSLEPELMGMNSR